MVLFTWVDAWTDLSRLFFNVQPHPRDWRVTLLQTGFILVVWGTVFLLTRRLLAHLCYLEGFLKVCAWCRKVGYKGQWIPLEKYLREGLHVETSHGVCPECFAKVKSDTDHITLEQVTETGTHPLAEAQTASPRVPEA
jgi:hypothetical protein